MYSKKITENVWKKQKRVACCFHSLEGLWSGFKPCFIKIQNVQMHWYWDHIVVINPAMRPCLGKILTSDMAMKQRLETAGMVTNDRNMG